MTFPNPAGYYLDLLPKVEAEITSLTFKDTKHLAVEVADYLRSDGHTFVTDGAMALSCEADDEIERLSESDRIALLRWLSDRLSFLVLNPVPVETHAATAS